MAKPTNAEWLVGLRAYFVELGETIDTVTVDETSIPDASPTSNWNDIGDILEGAQLTKEEEDDSYKKVTTTGWEKINDRNVILNGINFRTRQMTEPALRLMFGASAAIDDDTPFTQFADKDPKMEVFLLIQGRGEGVDKFRMIQRATLRMGQLPTVDSKKLSPSLVAEFKTATPNETVINPSVDDIIQILPDA